MTGRLRAEVTHMRRWLTFITGTGAAAVVVGLLAAPNAMAQQSVNFFFGGFVPTSADARGDIAGGTSNDVLVRDQQFLTFRIKDFDGFTFGGEWLVGLSNYFDAGLGVGYYQETVPAVDTNFVNANGSDVRANLKLRIVPITATFRVLPLGHHAAVQPYAGAGIGVFGWRYSEYGQFVDPTDHSIFNGTFVGTGWDVGPVLLGGVRVKTGGPTSAGFEARWQSGKGTLPTNQSFAGTVIDLGGMNYLATFNIRF
jgi:hypothetical protein